MDSAASPEEAMAAPIFRRRSGRASRRARGRWAPLLRIVVEGRADLLERLVRVYVRKLDDGRGTLAGVVARDALLDGGGDGRKLVERCKPLLCRLGRGLVLSLRGRGFVEDGRDFRCGIDGLDLACDLRVRFSDRRGLFHL